MKTLGLIGGMSWESTSEYYKILNTLVNEQLGAYHSCKSYMHSVDFDLVNQWLQHNNKKAIINYMLKVIDHFEYANVDLILLGTNTIHQYHPDLQKKTKIKILHIAEAVGAICVEKNLKKPLLLGTKYTMEKDFYKEFLNSQFNITALIPSKKDREFIHRVIFEELIKGKIKNKSRKQFLNIIDKSNKKGADSVILGCTEIPLLIKQKDCQLPVLDTTAIHASAAVDILLMNN